MKQNTITLSSGAVTLPLVRDGKSCGNLVLHPDDTAFLGRFYALLPKLEAQRTALASALAEQADPAAVLCAVNTVWAGLRADIDEVFGTGTSAMVFGEICSLALAQQFFEGVAQALQGARAPKLAQYTAPKADVLQ